MALNPPLVQVPGPPQGNANLFPAPYGGEYVCAGRDQCHFKIDGPRHFKFSGPGSVFLTNYRLVFVAKKPTAEIQSIELPLLFIDKQEVSQPIFGANNLNGVCRPVDSPSSGEVIKWKLSFTNGGMGTLVPLFYSCLEYIRVSSRRRQESPAEPEYDPPTGKAEQPAKPPVFLATALLDPSDPTKVYLTQPVDSSAQQNKPPQFPIV